MRKRLTITDLTRMKGDRVCIFGVDEEGNGVRPDIGSAGIREHHLLDKNGRRIVAPFAVVEFDLVRPVSKPPHTEDREMNPRHLPRLVRRLSVGEQKALLTNLLDRSVSDIFGAEIHVSQYVNEGEGRRSLGTVMASEVIDIKYSLTKHERYDYRMKFSDATGEVYDLPITDLAFRDYCGGQRLQGHATDVISHELKCRLSESRVFVRVGLARPFAKMYNRCYLQVSGVYAFPDYAGHRETTGASELTADKDYSAVVGALLSDPRPSNRAKAAHVLGETGDSSFVEALCRATRDADGNVRRLVASALGKIRDPRAVGSLSDLLADSRPQVRQYAVKALGEIGDGRALPVLEDCEEDTVLYVREAAKAAIEKIRRRLR